MLNIISHQENVQIKTIDINYSDDNKQKADNKCRK